MRVFERLDRRGRPAFAERHRGRLGPRAYSLLALTAQYEYSAEDVERMLQPHVRGDNNIDTVFIEFEDERIPVGHGGELRLVARLAVAYHNSLVRQNLGPARATQEPDAHEAASCAVLSDLGTADDTSTLFYSLDGDGSRDSDWDTVEYGDRAYHDQEFEMNEELGQPWLEKGEAAEERWGIWG
jgi:hypothetical protein